ncbi:MAG: hypothetical protein CR974_02780 [Gammaproteobacteria bacterium]|nr:MAG: hypothetical protein CR974_02780 [Gammaproteobacteria bacterium]
MDDILAELAQFPSAESMEEFLMQTVIEALKSGDTALLDQLSAFIIGDESANTRFSAYLRVRVLHCLIEYTIGRLQHIEDEEEADAVLQQLYHHLWRLKWVIYALPLDVELTQEAISYFNALMQDYYDRVNLSQSPVHKTLMIQNMLMGNIEQTRHHFQQWQTIDCDDFADCEACEVSELVNYHHFIGQYEAAIATAEPILDGRLSCGEVPHITYYPAISSLIEVGQWQRASELTQQAIALIADDIDNFLFVLPLIMQVAVRLGQYEQVQRLSDQYGEQILVRGEIDQLIRLQYYFAVMRFNPRFQEQARVLAEAFDERNGNHHYLLQWQRFIDEGRVH